MFIRLKLDPGADGAGGGQTVVDTGTGFSTNIDITNPDHSDFTPEPPNKDFRESIPEVYRNSKYLQDVKSYEDVFKKLDNAQSLIGKKSFSIPEENAPKEEWDKFFKTFGRPDTADGYNLEGFEADQKEYQNEIQNLFFNVGLSKKQAGVLQAGYDKILEKAIKNAGLDQEANDAEFNTMVTQVFGDKKEIIVAESNKLINECIPESAKPLLNNVSNEGLVVLASVLKGVRERYINEDSVTSNAGTGGMSTEEIREAAKEIMMTEAYRNPMHPQHDSAVRKRAELYEKLPK